MSDLVVIEFPTEAKAEEVRQKLLGLQKEYLIELGDAVIAVREPNGGVKLNQLVNTTAVGAVGGAFWGSLIGLIFLNPLIGASRRGFRRAERQIDRCRHQRSLHEGSGGDPAVRQRRAVPADPQADHRQGSRRGSRPRRQGHPDLLDHTKEQALRDALADAQAVVAAQPPQA